MSNLLKLEPALVWKYFYEITRVPRPSKKEGKIIAYLENFAKTNGFEYKKDEAGNIVIIKPATKGYENRKTIVLQSHVDMVCEKNSDKEFDFENDPIEAYVEDGWVKAKGTTLGGDDGIGMAVELAVLMDKSLEHPRIECLFTVDEETGLTGAFALKPGFVSGKTMLNLDSEDWGDLFIGCAGGRDTRGWFELKTEHAPNSLKALRIDVKGLPGGHSGDDIHKGLGNSIKIMTRILWRLTKMYDIRLSKFEGGNLRNAIPREAYAIILLNEKHESDIRKEIEVFEKEVKNEYAVKAPQLTVTCKEAPHEGLMLDHYLQMRLLSTLYALPHGEMAWSQTMPGLVETSTNLASVKFIDDRIEIGTSQRSSVESALNSMVNMVQSVFMLAGAKFESGDGYPGWEPRLDSPILEVTRNSFRKLFGKEPVVRAIHAGLECGIIGKNFEGMDMISFGPDVKGVHSPDEKLNIETVGYFWKLVVDILKNV